MADVKTDHRVAEEERSYKRNANPSYRTIQKAIRYAEFTYTFDATPSADDNVILGELGVSNARILPEFCRVSSLNGAMNGAGKFEKVDSDGTVTAVSGTATFNDDSVVAARISGNDIVEVESGEYLQFTITTVTAIVSGDIVSFGVAYISDDLQ